MFDSQFMALPGITPQEYTYLKAATNGLNEQQVRTFLMIYSGKRKNPSDMLIFCIVALFIFPPLHRFILGQVGYFVPVYLGIMLHRIYCRYR